MGFGCLIYNGFQRCYGFGLIRVQSPGKTADDSVARSGDGRGVRVIRIRSPITTCIDIYDTSVIVHHHRCASTAAVAEKKTKYYTRANAIYCFYRLRRHCFQSSAYCAITIYIRLLYIIASRQVLFFFYYYFKFYFTTFEQHSFSPDTASKHDHNNNNLLTERQCDKITMYYITIHKRCSARNVHVPTYN